jgi:signal transduction histidine kinase
MTKKKKFSSKLIIFVFSTSFLLIIGSFGYFYYSGNNYINNSAISELKNQFSNFDRASAAQLKEYSNEIDGSFFNIDLNIDMSKSRISNFLKLNKGIIDEIYILNKQNNECNIITPIIVFSGELVINYSAYDLSKFNNLLDQIIEIDNYNHITSFGYTNSNSIINYLLKKDFNSFCLVLKFNRNNLFDVVISRIYHPETIEFHLISNENVIDFSTNKFWVNQTLGKFLNGELLTDNYYSDTEKEIIYGRWQSQIFVSNLLVTNSISKYLNDFESISYKLLSYSVIVYLIIVLGTLLYTNKISKSLNEISKVSTLVGIGNFKNKINIYRNDELGLLIESFNQMVDNLSESYDKLNIANNELENKIDELVRTKNELTKKEKLALIGETISKISHEIQNKISGVSVWVQNLEMQSNLDDNALMYVEEIKRSLSSFIEMLQNFKKFYRKPYLEKSNFYFHNIIDKVIENYRADILAKKLDIRQKIPNKEIKIYADKVLLEEVIVNLLVNAIYFSPQKGKIEIDIVSNKKELYFSITDEGKGIEDHIIDNIFNPFFTTKSSGSGLGLAISKNIIEAHDGEIEVCKNVKMGARILLKLPLTI